LFRNGSRIQPQGVAARFACPIVVGSSRALASSLVRSPDTTEKLAQDRANRSKKGKVIYRKIDSVRVNPFAVGLGRQSQDPSVHRDR
jgi:hypothetical protein